MPQKLKQFIDSLIYGKSNKIPPHQKQLLIDKSFYQDNTVNFQVLESLPILFYIIEPTPPFLPTYINSKFETFGYSVRDWKDNPHIWEQTIHPEDFVWVSNKVQSAIQTGKDLDIEYRLIGKNGDIYQVHNQGNVVWHKEEILYFQGVITDISAQKKVEQKLRRRARLYRTISRNLPNTAIVLFDHDLRYTLAEGEELEKMGLSSKILEGKTLFEVFPKEVSDEWAKYYRGALAGGFISLEHEYKGVVFHNYILPLTNEKREIYGGMAIWHNITEKKKKDEKLKESEKWYREIFEDANDLIYIHDLDGKNLSMNKVAEKFFGYTQDELAQMEMKTLIAPEHHPLASRMLQKKLKSKINQTVYELNCLAKNGSKVTLEVNSRLIFKNDKPVGVQGIARNITQRKDTEKLWSSLDIELKDLFNSIDDLIVVLDKDGRYLKAPPTDHSLLYKPEEELIGKTVYEVFSKEKADFFYYKIKEVLEKQKTISVEYSLEIEGEIHWFYSRISPMPKDCVVIVARDITFRKLTEIALTESKEKYQELIENAHDLIYTIDLDGNFTSLNRAGERICGYKREEILQMKIEDIIAPEYLDEEKRSPKKKLKVKKSKTRMLEIISKDGHRVSIELSTQLIFKNGIPVGIQGIGRDVTDRKKNQEALNLSESQYRLLSEGIMHQVWTAQPDGMLDYTNGRVAEYFGEESENLLKEGWVKVVHPEDLPNCLENWTHSLSSGDSYETEFRLRRFDGSYRWHRALATAERDASGKVVKWFGTNTDIHDQKIAEEQLSYFAKHDPLTNLPNRNKFMDHLKRVINRKKYSSEHNFAVLFLDLDRFKVINDSLGHLIGDKLLIGIAERLESCVRPGDIVARLGGDEFTILLNNIKDCETAIRITNRLIQALSEPFKLGEYEVFTSASIGIVIADNIKRESEDYLRDADTAMYRAKAAGNSRYEIFNKEMHIFNINLLQLENDLRYGLERKEFAVFYQPIISLETGEIKEFESLIRWKHPKRGMVSPAEFIEVAEETGLIIPIGNWILQESCRQIVEWQKLSVETQNLFIAVNLSSKQLLYPNFIEHIKEALKLTNLNPQSLRVEVTETKIMENSEAALSILTELKNIGISLSTDDFGTGYSSLSYLHHFPFDCLKIDHSFIGEMDSNNKSEEIVRTILMLAQNLNLQVVAEGVETEEQLKLLQMLGCKLGQGYLFSRPVDAQTAERLLIEKSTKFTPPLLFNLPNNIVESSEIH